MYPDRLFIFSNHFGRSHTTPFRLREVERMCEAVKNNHQLPEAITEAQAKEEEVRKAQTKREAQEARQRDEEAFQPAYYERLKVRDRELQKEQPEVPKLPGEVGRRALRDRE